eukprot:2784784-Rhodomonas_salina.1
MAPLIPWTDARQKKRWPAYAMPGPDFAYGATRISYTVSTGLYPSVLRTPYAMSGTGWRSVLRKAYAMCGTELAYGASRRQSRWRRMHPGSDPT